jgi:TIR domain
VARIFLCYRSGDDAYAAALLDHRLSEIFGSQDIFRASRSIQPGENYPDAIMRALKQCETVLVVIGPTWAKKLSRAGGGSFTEDVDWVRTEIATALENGVRVIPILLSRTARLAEHHLPSDIADLARQKYLEFEHQNVERDFAQLVATLRTIGLLPTAEAHAAEAGSPHSARTCQNNGRFTVHGLITPGRGRCSRCPGCPWRAAASP